VDKSYTTALEGKRIVVTRAMEQSQSLVQALQQRGAVPIVLPMVAFGLPEDSSRLDAAIRGLADYDWLFLTSQNALRAIQERCQLLRLTLSDTAASVRIGAVGPATAAAVEQAGLKVSHVASRHQGTVLAEELADQVKEKRVLLPRSDRANPELVETLKRMGAQVTEIIAYRTIRPENADVVEAEKVVREGVDAVLFFSPSAVHHLQEMLGNEKFLEFSRRAVFTAIGPVTRDALRADGVQRIVLANDTTVPAALAALVDYFSRGTNRLATGVNSE
jgi:uroporphyrinogen III methyltransferase/synthase